MRNFVLGIILGTIVFAPALASGRDVNRWELAFMSYARGIYDGVALTDESILRNSTEYANRVMVDNRPTVSPEEYNSIYDKVEKGLK